MSAHSIAVTTWYIAAGMGKTVDELAIDMGHIEVIDTAATYGVMSGEMLDKIVGDFDEWPGVYDYEVSEPFGTWLSRYVSKHSALPTQDEAKQEMAGLIARFFSNCYPNDLRSAVAEVELKRRLLA